MQQRRMTNRSSVPICRDQGQLAPHRTWRPVRLQPALPGITPAAAREPADPNSSRFNDRPWPEMMANPTSNSAVGLAVLAVNAVTGSITLVGSADTRG